MNMIEEREERIRDAAEVLFDALGGIEMMLEMEAELFKLHPERFANPADVLDRLNGMRAHCQKALRIAGWRHRERGL